MATLKVTDVFVPGGLPKYTYVARTDRLLEEQIAAAKENLCKITTVTGATKSGKTVLVRTVLKNDSPIWVDGGAISEMDQFLDMLADELQVEDANETTSHSGTSEEITGDLEVEAGIVIAKGKGKIGGKLGANSATSKKVTYARSIRARVSQHLIDTKRPLVIDDFHYLSRELQGQVTRFLKPLVFGGVPIIYLAIPHRRYDAVKVEREMNGRIKQVPVPVWESRELAQIAQLGFPLLHIDPHMATSGKLAAESHGSPHLMQEFCRQICFLSNMRERSTELRQINPKFPYETIFTQVATDLGKVLFDKLARGPSARTDRIQRPLKSGQTADIYRVTILALANLRPGVASIDYETLRASMREILSGDLPQAHEVSRVLEHMGKIASQDESSVAVIDYEKDERRLHITDPFFAFFLRWGKDIISNAAV